MFRSPEDLNPNARGKSLIIFSLPTSSLHRLVCDPFDEAADSSDAIPTVVERETIRASRRGPGSLHLHPLC